MRRALVALVLLLAAAPLRAADVPLSDRPLAPIPGVGQVVASASPDAVLAVFVASSDVYAQRIALDGAPLDPAATYLGSGSFGSTAQVLWDGSRWIVLWIDFTARARVAWVDASGAFDGPYELPLRQFNQLTFLGERVVVSAYEPGERPGTSRRLFLELTGTNVLVPLSTVDLIGNDLRGSWTIGLDEGPGVVVYRLTYVHPIFDAIVSVHRPGGVSSEIELKTSSPSIVRFIARREGGGLLVWNDGGLQGAIIGSDASISSSFRIGPPGEMTEQIVTDEHGEGWDILFSRGSEMWLARVDAGGQVAAAPVGRGAAPSDFTSDLVTIRDADLLLERGWVAGVTVRRIAGGRLGDPIAAGAGGAAQFRAHAATGDGVDLVVWEEQSSDAVVLRATRVAPHGAPLDGPGLLVADESLTKWIRSSYRSDFDVAFDGEAFVVAWVRRDDGDTVMMRRVWPDGSLSVALGLATWAKIEGVSVAGAARGSSAVAWSGLETWDASPASLFVPIVGGRLGAAVEIGSGNLGWAVPNLSASSDRYLAVFNDSTPCYITCEPTERPYARSFTLDGTPLTEPHRISTRIIGPVVPEVVSDGRDFFVVWDDVLVRIDPELTVSDEKTLASGGSLSIEGTEIRIDRWRTRLVYSRSGDLLRFEPLPPHNFTPTAPPPDSSPSPLLPEESRVASLGRDRFIIRVQAHPVRLVIRSMAEPLPRSADLAVVATGEIIPPPKQTASSGFLASFRIEHRGGAPVRAIDLWSDMLIFGVPDQPPGFGLDLDPGESITVIVWLRRDSFGGSLWVAGDVIDLIPANNVDSYGPRLRRRTVSR